MIVKIKKFLISIIFITPLCSVFADDLEEMKEQFKVLMNENKRIQQDNQALNEQLNKQKKLIDQLLDKFEELEIKSEENEISQDVTTSAEGILAEEFLPNLSIKGFSDINFIAELEDIPGVNDQFFVGQFDLFITSPIADNISILSELIFEFDEMNETVIDLERFNIKYNFSEKLNLRAGRMHTPLGYYNETFHHGTWFQTAATRPSIHQFEDDGGILPVHTVGLEIFGVLPFDTFGLKYNLSIGNGRGKKVSEIQNVIDSNSHKSVSLLLSAIPENTPEFRIGANIHLDKIPADDAATAIAARKSSIDELIVGGHIIYAGDPLELLFEISYIQHDDQLSARKYETTGLYFQAAYAFEKIKPYYRFDFIDFNNSDPFFLTANIDIAKHTIGTRWDIYSWNALKLEYSYADRDDTDNTQTITIQSTFTF